MDMKLLREKLNRALRATVKSAIVLSPTALLVCSPGPGGTGGSNGGPTSAVFPFTGDAGALFDGGCLAFCEAQPAPPGDSANGPLFVNCGGTLDLSDGGLAVVCGYTHPAGIGRLLSWVKPPRSLEARTLLGGFFAEVSRLEAASVTAFAHLAGELSRHGAPRSLRARARAAAAEEARHARVTGALARRFGGLPQPPEFEQAPVAPNLEALALENAVEGCARETHGALVTAWQARFSRDRGVRRAMARIAADEARHAALGWAVAAWAEPRLSKAARQRVLQARKATLEGLAAELDREVPRDLVALAGLPDRRAGGLLAANLARELAA